MTSLRNWLCSIALTALAGCQAPQNTVMSGNADGVAINYAGDVSATAPLAQRHCAQFERRPVLRSATENTAIYACVRRDTER